MNNNKEKMSNKKKIGLYISGITTLGVIATSTFLGLTFTQNKKTTDSRIAILHNIIKGNGLMANAFRSQMMSATGGGLVNEKKIKNSKVNGAIKTNIKEGYIKGFKAALTKWLTTYKTQLNSVKFDASVETVLSWFDFTGSTIALDATSPTWNYTDNSASKTIKPYSKYDIKMPLKDGTGDWKFKIISYLDPKNADLVKALKFNVDALHFIGQKDTNGAVVKEHVLFNAVHEAAMANNQSDFDVAVKALAKDLALEQIVGQVTKIKELANLRIHYSVMDQIKDIQKLNIDLGKYKNDLTIDPSTKLPKKDANGKYALANPDDSTIVKAVIKTFAAYGMDHFAKWKKPGNGIQNQDDYSFINGHQAYKIDISGKLGQSTVNILDYTYEINKELGDTQTQSWTSASNISFYILRSDNMAKADVLKTLLAKYAAIGSITKSRDNKANLIAMIDQIKGLLANQEVVDELGSDKLWFELESTGDNTFDGTTGGHHKIDKNTDSSDLADQILKLDSAKITKIFGIVHTKMPGKKDLETANVNGSFKLQEDTNPELTLNIGTGLSTTITFNIDRSVVEMMEMLGVISNSLTDKIGYTQTNGDVGLIEAIKTHIMTNVVTWRTNNGFNWAAKLPFDKTNIIIKNIRHFDKTTFIVDMYFKLGAKEFPVSLDTPIST